MPPTPVHRRSLDALVGHRSDRRGRLRICRRVRDNVGPSFLPGELARTGSIRLAVEKHSPSITPDSPRHRHRGAP